MSLLVYYVELTVDNSPQLHFNDSMSKYRQLLKCKYELLDLVSIDENFSCSATDYFDLTLVKIDRQGRTTSTENRRGDIITLSEALDVEEEKKKIILIKGDPGMGKTTLAINVCKCWANDSLLQNYKAVTLLPLRDPEIQEAKTIGDLLLIPGDEMRRMVLNEIGEYFGDGICFILEGYDELPSSLQKSSLFTKLKDFFPKCTIIYTSRPGACNKLESVASQIIQIEGFKQESVDEYISNTFQGIHNGEQLVSQLKSQLQRNVTLERMLHVPINVAIVCLIFLHFSSLPETLTELYTLLCLRLILRHITTRTANPAQVEAIYSLNDLPKDIAEKFSQLCFIAYKGIECNSTIYSSQQLQSFSVSIDKICGLGLLIDAPSISVYGREKSYNFLHKTVQEFCAAWYISKLSIQDQIEWVRTTWDNSVNTSNYALWPWYHFNCVMVLKFYCGITGLRSNEILYLLLPYKMIKLHYSRRNLPLLMHCVYEAQNDELCQVIGDHFDGRFDVTADVYMLTYETIPHVLDYFLTHYRGELLQINASIHTNFEFQMLCATLQKRLFLNDNVTLSLNSMYCKITSQSLSYFTTLLTMQYPIMELQINYIQLQSDTNAMNFVRYVHKSLLTLSDVQLLSQIFTSKSTLTILDISGTHMSPEGQVCFGNLRNVMIRDLRMARCSLHAAGADSIGKMLYHNPSIMSIDLSGNGIEDSGVERLVYHLNKSNKLQHLALMGNGITAVGANHLRKLIATDQPTLTSIELSGNYLKDDGAYTILSSLTVTMEHIGLSNIKMTSSSCHIVATTLHKVRSISIAIPDHCEVIIAAAIAATTTLKKLHISRIDEQSSAHKEVYYAIGQNKSIEKFKLGRTPFCNKWVSGMVCILKHSKSLREMNVYTCLIVSHEDLLPLADVLTHNNTIKTLTIQHNKMTCKSVMIFLEKLKHNNVLEELTLGSVDTRDYESNQFFNDVEKYVKDINQARRTAGISCQLKVIF